MIEQSQKVLLDAIKASLFEVAFSYPNDTDWDAVIKEAKAQAVIGLISPVIPVHDESSDQSIAHYMRLLHGQDKLINLLNNNNIPCVILKGCAAAMYYPKPYLRAMGDVDFLVPHDRFEETMKLMELNGYVYTEGKNDDGGLAINARHVGYQKNGIEFELHHHFSSMGFNIDDILEKAIENREYREMNGYSFPVLPEIENGLVLLGHIHHHLKISELGIRQIIDWEMYYHSVMDDEKWEKEFMPIVKERGLFKLVSNVTRMCEKHLGLPKTIKRNKTVETDIPDELLENLLNYGNFGRKQSLSSENSGECIRSVVGIIKNKGLYSYFQDNGLDNWNLCKRIHILRPFAFIYGFFRFLIRGTLGIVKTGRFKEQIIYIKKKNKYDRDLGINISETNKK